MTASNHRKSPSAFCIAALRDVVDCLPANFTNVPRWERQQRCTRLAQPAVIHTQLIAGQCDVNTDTYWPSVSTQAGRPVVTGRLISLLSETKRTAQRSKLNPKVQKYAQPLENREKETYGALQYLELWRPWPEYGPKRHRSVTEIFICNAPGLSALGARYIHTYTHT